VANDEVDVEIEVAGVEKGSAGQPQVDPIIERLVATIFAAVIVDHAEVALVDVFGREEEAVVVGPHGALDLTKIARHIPEDAIAVRSRCARIRRLRIDLVARGQRRTPTVIVERPEEVVDVGGAIALGAIVGIVEVNLSLVSTESVVLRPVDGLVLVDPGQDGFAVSTLYQEWRQRTIGGYAPRIDPARAIGPDAVRLLRRKVGMEAAVRHDWAYRHYVADLREELVPPLMRENLARWTALD